MNANKNLKKVLLLMFVLILTGCSQKEILTETVVVNKTPLNLKNPEPIKLNNINYYIITKDNANSVFDSLQKQDKELVLFAIDPTDYENLSLNILYIKKYLIEQQNIINAYKEYYEKSEKEEIKDKI